MVYVNTIFLGHALKHVTFLKYKPSKEISKNIVHA